MQRVDQTHDGSRRSTGAPDRVTANKTNAECPSAAARSGQFRRVRGIDRAITISLPCGHGCWWIQWSCLFSSATTLATGRADPRACLSCGEADSVRRLPTLVVLAAFFFLFTFHGCRPRPEPKSFHTKQSTSHCDQRGDDTAPVGEYQQPGAAHTTFDGFVRVHERYLLVPLFCDVLARPREAHARFPGPAEWDTVVRQCRPKLEVVNATAEHVLVRLFCQNLYIAPHVQEVLIRLHPAWESPLELWACQVNLPLGGDRGAPRSRRNWRRLRGGRR